MKWHLIGVLILVGLLLDETLAGRGSFNFGKSKSRSRSPTPRNDPANRHSTSTAVVPYNPRSSYFAPIPSISHPAPVPSTSSSSTRQPSPNRFAHLPSTSRTSPPMLVPPNFYQSLPRYRSPLPAPRGDRWERRGNKRPKPTLDPLKTQKAPKNPGQPSSVGPRSSSPRPRSNSSRLPTIQQLTNYARNPQPSTSSSNSGPSLTSPVTFQPAVPPSLAQIDLDPAEQKRLARQQAKIAKSQAKAIKVDKNKAKKGKASQVPILEGMKYPNAGAVKCSNPNAPPESCFDFYILAVSWGPVARVIRLGAAPHLEEKIRPEWTLHGLWPSLTSFNRVPESCNLNIRWSTSEVRSIYSTLKRKWFTTYSRYRTNEAFWQHEWDKHGRCAARSHFINKDVLAYFKIGLNLFDKANMKEKLSRANITPGTTLSLKDMRNAISDALGTRVNLQHIVNRKLDLTYLLEIMICYDMRFQPMDCPTHHKYYNDEIKDKPMVLVPDLVPEHKIIWEDPNETSSD